MNTPHTPKNLGIERKVIGTLLLNADHLTKISDIIHRDTFVMREHLETFAVIEQQFMDNVPVSIDGVNAELRKKGMKFNVAEFVQHGVAGRYIVHDAMLLRELEVSRNQINFSFAVNVMATEDDADPFQVNDYMISEVERITSLTDIRKPKTNQELISANTLRMELAAQSKGITGVPTGFQSLDEIYGGRQPTDLVIKAGRPAMGKTAQALTEAYHMAVNHDKHVAFFSLEMGAEQLMQRLISIHTPITLSNIKAGTLSQQDWNVYNSSVQDLIDSKIAIVDDVYSLTNIRTRCKKLKMQNRLDVVFIDYLQLIVHRVDAGRSKANEVAEVSRSLKMMAKDLNVPVIALSQLNRACETRADKKPLLSDLRESGSIEQDADIVEMVYRPEYYSDLREQDEFGDLNGKAWILIQKNRHGATKDVEFIFDAPRTRFLEFNEQHTDGPTPF